MREIEFRVWDSQEKVYLNKKDIAIDNLGNVFVFEGCNCLKAVDGENGNA